MLTESDSENGDRVARDACVGNDRIRLLKRGKIDLFSSSPTVPLQYPSVPYHTLAVSLPYPSVPYGILPYPYRIPYPLMSSSHWFALLLARARVNAEGAWSGAEAENEKDRNDHEEHHATLQENRRMIFDLWSLIFKLRGGLGDEDTPKQR